MRHLTLVEKAFFLKKTELFSELDLDLLLAISDKAEERFFRPQGTIFSLNQEAHKLYIILDGCVSITDKQGKMIASLKPHDYFGDEALISNKLRGYLAMATEKTHLLTISRTHCFEIMLESPQIAISLLRAYASALPFRKRKEEEQA